jgi:hypothetical protein
MPNLRRQTAKRSRPFVPGDNGNRLTTPRSSVSSDHSMASASFDQAIGGETAATQALGPSMVWPSIQPVVVDSALLLEQSLVRLDCLRAALNGLVLEIDHWEALTRGHLAGMHDEHTAAGPLVPIVPVVPVQHVPPLVVQLPPGPLLGKYLFCLTLGFFCN